MKNASIQQSNEINIDIEEFSQVKMFQEVMFNV